MQDNSAGYISCLLAGDAGMRLLRSRSATYVISFLYTNFRSKHNQVIESDILEHLLADFLTDSATDMDDELSDEIPTDNGSSQKKIENVAPDAKARILISRWCSDNYAYLRRYHTERGVPVVELSASLERLFSWLEDLEPKAFVGTESRFEDILHRLRDLSEHTTEDPEVRIAELVKQRKALTEKIKQISETGQAQVYTTVQITERLAELSRSARDLLADFRQVEDNFRGILGGIYREQADLDESRGKILGYTLDANQKMQESPQGQTFNTFMAFLAQDAGKNEINTLALSLLSQVREQGVDWSDTFLLHLKQYLFEAGRKVIDANHLLADRLNRVLAQQAQNDRKRVTQLIQEIKKRAFSCMDQRKSVSDGEPFLYIQGKPNLYFPQARVPIFPQDATVLAPVTNFNTTFDREPERFSDLFSQFYVDEKKLEQNIEDYHSKNAQVFSLAQLLKLYPVKQGLAEVIAYFDIAGKRDDIHILTDKKENITYMELESGTEVTLSVPRMLFA